jgi:Sec-independent protein secretion pathway component TatC
MDGFPFLIRQSQGRLCEFRQTPRKNDEERRNPPGSEALPAGLRPGCPDLSASEVASYPSRSKPCSVVSASRNDDHLDRRLRSSGSKKLPRSGSRWARPSGVQENSEEIKEKIEQEIRADEIRSVGRRPASSKTPYKDAKENEEGKKSPDEMTSLNISKTQEAALYSLIGLFVAVIPAAYSAKISSHPDEAGHHTAEGRSWLHHPDRPFTVYLKVAPERALFLGRRSSSRSPYFVAPLIPKEKKYVTRSSSSRRSFHPGSLFRYFIVSSLGLPLLPSIGLGFAVITIDQYFSLILKLLLGIGAVFEMPTLIFPIAHNCDIPMDDQNFIRHPGRLRLSAVITPTPDPINQSILACP